MAETAKLRGHSLRRSWFLRGTAHYGTLWLNASLPGAIPLVYVMGYPKSGTTWVSQLVSDYLQLPMPRAPLLPVAFPAVVQGHQTMRPSFRRCFYVARDGRDVLTSLYFFLAKRLPEGDNPQLTRRQRRNFPGLRNRDDVARNFAPFVEAQLRNPLASKVHWGEHVRRYIEGGRTDVPLIKYEDLYSDSTGALSRAMESFTGEPADPDRVRWAVEKYSFAKQTGRKAGQEDRRSFLRKGGAGDWRNHFTREAAEMFEASCGASLRALGYAEDGSWVEECGAPRGEAVPA